MCSRKWALPESGTGCWADPASTAQEQLDLPARRFVLDDVVAKAVVELPGGDVGRDLDRGVVGRRDPVDVGPGPEVSCCPGIPRSAALTHHRCRLRRRCHPGRTVDIAGGVVGPRGKAAATSDSTRATTTATVSRLSGAAFMGLCNKTTPRRAWQPVSMNPATPRARVSQSDSTPDRRRTTAVGQVAGEGLDPSLPVG